MAEAWDSTIKEEIRLVEEEMRRSVSSEQPLLTEISLYVIGAGGKRMRPGVTILSFKATGGGTPEKAIRMASAFEMIHSATLIHDDINDEGEFRRGRVAAYRKYGTQRALIAGDFLFVQSFRLGGIFDETVVEMIASACTAIAESEMLQSFYEFDPETPIEAYIKIVEGKTAKPIEAGARVGAYLSKSTPEVMEAMGRYGLNMGIAFQIVDDIMDIEGNQETMGKPHGIDFLDGKPTLPMLIAMKDPHKGAQIRELFMRKSRNLAELDQALALIKSTDAVDRARAEAKRYVELAKKELSVLPPSHYKDGMLCLANVVVERNA
ncbi:MAG: polyprenyl synthetase family protein [Methanomassiliicoccales archaeon]